MNLKPPLVKTLESFSNLDLYIMVSSQNLVASPTPADIKWLAEQKIVELQETLRNPDPNWPTHADYLRGEIDYYNSLTDVERAPVIHVSSYIPFGGIVDVAAYLYVTAQGEEFDAVGFTGGCTYTRKANK